MRIAYSQEFFHRVSSTSHDSAATLVPLLTSLFHPTSVLDVGCGEGAWLNEFMKCGVEEILGLDGPWVSPSSLKIPRELFRGVNLEEPLGLDRRFDLVVCLEVAEHLGPQVAARLVDDLIQVGDVVCFSAAVPGQGGVNHVNEQWPGHWAALFAEREYVVSDALRPRLWSDDRVAWWFAQNTLLFVRKHLLASMPREVRDAVTEDLQGLARVHPRRFALESELVRDARANPDASLLSVTQCLRLLGVATRNSLARRLGLRSR